MLAAAAEKGLITQFDKLDCTVGQNSIQQNESAAEAFNSVLKTRLLTPDGDEFNEKTK